MKSREILIEGGEALGLSLSSRQLDSFLHFLELFQIWNRQINLTSIREEEEIVVRHFLDSLSCYRAVKERSGPFLDVGTGAGFPSIPLLLYDPHLQITLLDSSRKKCFFLQEVRRRLHINPRIVQGRVEEFAHQEQERGNYNMVIARALAPLHQLVELAMPLLIVGGRLLSFQSAGVHEEIKAASRALSLLQGQILEKQVVSIPFLSAERYLLLIEKVGETREEFPRRMKQVRKTPL